MTTVIVYFYRRHDVVNDQSIVSQRRATLETIAPCRGEAVLETALEVDSARLDAEGFLPKEV